MRLPLYQVDAFAGHVFSGNPAASVAMPHWLPEPMLQSIAEENNLSETAFVVRSEAAFEIRWFTPVAEVDLAAFREFYDTCSPPARE